MQKIKKKTLFEDQLDDIFLKPVKGLVKPDMKEPKLKENFYISISGKKPEFIKYNFEMYENILTCRKEANTPEIAYMDVMNAFMKLSDEVVMIDEVPHYGIKFIKKRTYEEIFNPDQDVINTWYEALKFYCVLTKFRNYFESIKVLGQGAFAKVFLVSRLSDKKEFAVKVFNKAAIMEDPSEMKCLAYEIKMMRMMNHYRVLRMHELYEGENFIYCLCEWYKGLDLLKAIVKKGSQPEQKALTIIFQILEGIYYMHNRGVMHRDLKPENIIFKQSSEIDIGIVDLGFSTLESDYKKLFVRCGTPGYVAPEILNDKEYDCKVDVYSCGIIFYMIITGKIPFQGENYKEVVFKNLKGKIDFDFTGLNINISADSLLISSEFVATNVENRPQRQNKQ